MDNVDVVVIGAGAAGIAAARALAARHSVLVLEARNRIGGRAWTFRYGDIGLDLGATWLHSADENEWGALAPGLGFAVDAMPPPWERPAHRANFSQSERADYHAAWDRFYQRIDDAAAEESTRLMSEFLEPGGRWNGLLGAMVTYINGVEADQLVVREYAHYRDTLNGRPEWHRGTAYHHPDFDNDDFASFDLGVVILDRPVQLATYGRLPTLRYLDRFKGKEKAQLFESVGYGVETSTPKTETGGDTRRISIQKIVNFNGVHGMGPNIALLFSHNNSSKHTGGTCYGDSGGPTFVAGTNLMVAITSWGIQPNCTGNDVQYRVDQSDDLGWLAAVAAGHPR